jgi:hypothetical protein
MKFPRSRLHPPHYLMQLSLQSVRLSVALRSTVGNFSKSMRVYMLLVPFLILALWPTPCIHQRSQNSWGSNAKDHDFFGSKVAISGDFAVVGAPAGNPYDAKVYFYKKTQSALDRARRLHPAKPRE